MTESHKDPLLTSAAFMAYEIAFAAGILTFAPYALVKMLNTPAYRAGFAQRLSLKGATGKNDISSSPALIQAVSLGEVKSVAPLIHAVLEQTDCPIHLTTTTETGHQMANRLFPNVADISFFPLDFSFAARRMLSRIRPRVIVLFETEIWPNFIRMAASLKIPVLIINGRISERSYRWYRLLPAIFRNTFAKISRMGMQSTSDAERAVALGADRDCVRICGNMKFDAVAKPPSAERIEHIRRALLLPQDASLIVGGSTHEGEEKALLSAFKRIQAKRPDARLLLAPRHPERFNDVEALIRQEGFDVLRRSACSGSAQSPGSRTVILLDTIGELAQVYALSTISFVGGSLAKVGGHNIIEPASVGKPLLFGPHMQNFKDIKDAFLAEQAAVCVGSDEELYHHMHALLENPSKAGALADAAIRVVARHRGATARYFDLLKDFL